MAVGTAEHKIVEPNGTTLSLVEISDAVTDRDYWGRGLNSALTKALIEKVTKSVSPDVVYIEANTLSPGMLKVATYAGFTFALNSDGQIGIMENHMLIDGRLSSLAVGYLLRKDFAKSNDEK